ncbi:MAG: phage tail assembly protein, partial [Chloroflexota bacterium]|nr:phage tail assembly protein [Chloroflexota bacterium]
ELEAMAHPRVRANDIYLSVYLFSRVITKLGTLSTITPAIIESLFSTDFMYLQELYMQINVSNANLVETQCPTCGTRFVLDVNDGLTAD